ncbi:MAG TPA: nuclease-related domain-containing protein [Streptosporangiaceae bacterium]|nr:nuclease-related domain-containing protein [Streptosporangiaceae bacterium]
MRIEVLSEYPDVMLADAERERRRSAVEQMARVESLREERRRARSKGRWLDWMRLALTVSGAKREATRQHVASILPTAREQTIRAGRNAERRVADELAKVLDDEWVLLRGYHNSRGEIDALLLGPRGLFAIEEKYRSVRIYVRGDAWMAEQIDKYGKSRSARFPIRDGKGRSPSEQVKEPVAALSRWLSTNKRGTPITPVVLLTHPGARIGSLQDPTVRVEKSVRRLLALIERSRYTLDAGRRADIERLIHRDHTSHGARKPPA